MLSIVLLIVMTACAKPASKEESSDRIEEVQAADESAAEQGQAAEESAEEQGQAADESAAEQGQSADESAAEQGQSAEDAMLLLQQADEVAQEKYDNLDLNDKASVMELVQALMQMNSAIQRAKDQQIATWDDDRKILSIDEEEDN